MKNNNYPTWLVSLEIAKELKKIGFDEPCLVENVETHSEDYNLIGFEEQIPFDVHVMLEEIVFVKNQDLKDEFGIYKTFVLRTAIPTWEQVFEWFREKGLYSFIRVNIPDLSVSYFIYDKDGYIEENGHRSTYEDAQDDCVKELIKIYKEHE